jgi:hypothetical protein
MPSTTPACANRLRLGVVDTDEPWLTSVPPAEPAYSSLSDRPGIRRAQDPFGRLEAHCPPCGEAAR